MTVDDSTLMLLKLSREHDERTRAWLRQLADFVEREVIPASDVAQALFSPDTYTVDCPLHESAECDELAQAIAYEKTP